MSATNTTAPSAPKEGATLRDLHSVSLLVARLTREANPIATMALAMLSYFTKLILMAIFLIAVTRLTEPETVDRTAFGLSALAITFAWLTGEVRSFFKLRLELTPKHE